MKYTWKIDIRHNEIYNKVLIRWIKIQFSWSHVTPPHTGLNDPGDHKLTSPWKCPPPYMISLLIQDQYHEPVLSSPSKTNAQPSKNKKKFYKNISSTPSLLFFSSL